MKKITFISIFFITLLAKAQQPVFDWVKNLGNSWEATISSIVTDKSGNVYVAGTYNSVTDFDLGINTYTLSSIHSDCFVAKYTNSGNFIWAKAIKGNDYDHTYQMVLDANNNVYMIGHFIANTTQIVDLDPGPNTYTLSFYNSSPATNYYIVKLDSLGDFVWGNYLPNTICNGLSVDANGNPYIIGYFYSTVDFDMSSNVANVTSYGGRDIYILKLDINGHFAWVKRMGGLGDDSGISICVDGLGNIVSTGSFNSSVANFDPNVTFNITKLGGIDVFISKLNSTGNFVSATSLGFNGVSFGINDIGTDKQGNIYVSGAFIGSFSYNNGVQTFSVSSNGGGQDGFIAKVTNTSNLKWFNRLGSASSDYIRQLDIDSLNNTYCTGYYSASADFASNTNTMSVSAFGGRDIMVSKIDSVGNILWIYGMGGTSNDIGGSISVDKQENIFTTGAFHGTVDFDPGSLVYPITSTTFNSDVFIHKMNQSIPTDITKYAKDDIYSIYPNPSTTTLNIKSEKEIGFVHITNVLGETVLVQSIAVKEATINLNQLSHGIYFIAFGGRMTKFIKE